MIDDVVLDFEFVGLYYNGCCLKKINEEAGKCTLNVGYKNWELQSGGMNFLFDSRWATSRCFS